MASKKTIPASSLQNALYHHFKLIAVYLLLVQTGASHPAPAAKPQDDLSGSEAGLNLAGSEHRRLLLLEETLAVFSEKTFEYKQENIHSWIQKDNRAASLPSLVWNGFISLDSSAYIAVYVGIGLSLLCPLLAWLIRGRLRKSLRRGGRGEACRSITKLVCAIFLALFVMATVNLLYFVSVSMIDMRKSARDRSNLIFTGTWDMNKEFVGLDFLAKQVNTLTKKMETFNKQFVIGKDLISNLAQIKARELSLKDIHERMTSLSLGNSLVWNKTTERSSYIQLDLQAVLIDSSLFNKTTNPYDYQNLTDFSAKLAGISSKIQAMRDDTLYLEGVSQSKLFTTLLGLLLGFILLLLVSASCQPESSKTVSWKVFQAGLCLAFIVIGLLVNLLACALLSLTFASDYTCKVGKQVFQDDKYALPNPRLYEDYQWTIRNCLAPNASGDTRSVFNFELTLDPVEVGPAFFRSGVYESRTRFLDGIVEKALSQYGGLTNLTDWVQKTIATVSSSSPLAASYPLCPPVFQKFLSMPTSQFATYLSSDLMQFFNCSYKFISDPSILNRVYTLDLALFTDAVTFYGNILYQRNENLKYTFSSLASEIFATKTLYEQKNRWLQGLDCRVFRTESLRFMNKLCGENELKYHLFVTSIFLFSLGIVLPLCIFVFQIFSQGPEEANDGSNYKENKVTENATLTQEITGPSVHQKVERSTNLSPLKSALKKGNNRKYSGELLEENEKRVDEELERSQLQATERNQLTAFNSSHWNSMQDQKEIPSSSKLNRKIVERKETKLEEVEYEAEEDEDWEDEEEEEEEEEGEEEEGQRTEGVKVGSQMIVPEKEDKYSQADEVYEYQIDELRDPMPDLKRITEESEPVSSEKKEEDLNRRSTRTEKDNESGAIKQLPSSIKEAEPLNEVEISESRESKMVERMDSTSKKDSIESRNSLPVVGPIVTEDLSDADASRRQENSTWQQALAPDSQHSQSNRTKNLELDTFKSFADSLSGLDLLAVNPEAPVPIVAGNLL